MSFSITILGSSGAIPAYERFTACQLIEIQNHHFLVDCGEGAQMQLRRYHKNIHRINHIFISHLHADHYLGLMGLLFTMHLQRRTNALHLYAPPGLDEIVITQLRYSQSTLNFQVHFHPLEYEQACIFENDKLTIETIPLHHKISCTGFLFKEKPKPRRIDKQTLPPNLSYAQISSLKNGLDVMDTEGNLLYTNSSLTHPPRLSRSYAYCSDTAWHEKILPQIQGVSCLYHEATFVQTDRDKAKKTFHSTAIEAAEMAKRAGTKKLLLGHFSARYRELDPLLEEARKVFSASYLAHEGDVISIPD